MQMQYGVIEIENVESVTDFGDWVEFVSDGSVVRIAPDVVLALLPVAKEIAEMMEKRDA